MTGRKPPPAPNPIRQERLAEALRANLRRRKAAAAGRPADPGDQPKGRDTAGDSPSEPRDSGARRP